MRSGFASLFFFPSAKNVQDIAGKGRSGERGFQAGGKKELRGRDDESEKLAWLRLESLNTRAMPGRSAASYRALVVIFKPSKSDPGAA